MDILIKIFDAAVIVGCTSQFVSCILQVKSYLRLRKIRDAFTAKKAEVKATPAPVTIPAVKTTIPKLPAKIGTVIAQHDGRPSNIWSPR